MIDSDDPRSSWSTQPSLWAPFAYCVLVLLATITWIALEGQRGVPNNTGGAVCLLAERRAGGGSLHDEYCVGKTLGFGGFGRDTDLARVGL